MTDPGPARDGAPAIETSGLTKRFGSVVALDGLDLAVPRGIVFGLLGPNGAGKTTTIRLLAGLARPTAGGARVAGVDVTRGNGLAARRKLGVLDQDPRFYGWMTGRDLLAFAADLAGVPRADSRRVVDETLARVGLEEAANRRISGYSGGMRQRLGIGQAIVGSPEILILDEPVSSLDPEGRRDLLTLIADLREHATVVFSTHVLSDVERICDRVAILDHGRLVVESGLEDLLSRYAPPMYAVDADAGQGAALAELAGRLRGRPWVAGIEVAGDLLRVSVSDGKRAAVEILPAVAAAGIRVSSIERSRPTLEDVFLRLVAPSDRPDDGGSPA